MRRTILEQKAITRLIVDEFPRAIPFAEIFFRKRLAVNEFLHFVACEKIIAVVDRLVADTDSRYEVLKMIRATFDKNIGRVKQIGTVGKLKVNNESS